MPGLPAAQLRRSQAILARLHDPGPAPALEDASLLLRTVEDAALAVRRARQQWGGATGEALALAGRARLEAGDPVGALRLLRPAPHGQATADRGQDRRGPPVRGDRRAARRGQRASARALVRPAGQRSRRSWYVAPPSPAPPE